MSWINAKDPAVHFRLVCTFSFLMTLFCVYVGDYTLPGGASQFTQWSDALAQGTKPGIAVSQRDIGYPLLLLLTGYSATGSILGISILQIVFALLMPILVYVTIGKEFSRIAFFTSLAVILSMAPFQYMKWIHHDQPFIFFNLLTLYAFSLLVRSKGLWPLYLLTFAILASSLTRPAGNFIYLLLLPLAFFVKPRLSLHYLLAPLLFVSTILFYQQYRERIFSIADGQKMPSYTGQQLFYNLYVNSGIHGTRLDEQRLPHLQALLQLLHQAVSPDPSQSKMVQTMITIRNYSDGFRKEAFSDTDPDRFIQRFLDAPNYEYFEMLSSLAGFANDDLFLQASKEIALAYPLHTLSYTMRNLYYYFFKPGYVHSRDIADSFMRSSPVFLPIVKGKGIANEPGISEKALQELSVSAYLEAPHALQLTMRLIRITWKTMYRPLNFLSSLLTVAALAIWVLAILPGQRRTIRLPQTVQTYARRMTAPFLVSFIILFYNGLISAAFAEPSYRYHYHTIMFQIVTAGYGVILLQAWLAQTNIPTLLRQRWYGIRQKQPL